MFSYQASSCPQLMQAEPGLTIERFNGTRVATTFRKLPIARAGANDAAARANDTALLPFVDGRLRFRIGDGVTGHSGRNNGESRPGGVDCLTDLHGSAVEGPVRVRRRCDVDPIGGVERSLETGAVEENAV